MGEKKRKYKERLNIDATPDGDYALRILQSYRDACDIQWSNNTAGLEISNEMCLELNKLQEQRAKELDKAIKLLNK